jgi:hypothetical protein
MVKVPLIVVAAFATYWTFSSMMNGMSPFMRASGPAGFGNMMGVVEALIWGAIAMIYPVAVLIVLSTRTSKDWLRILNPKMDGGASHSV